MVACNVDHDGLAEKLREKFGMKFTLMMGVFSDGKLAFSVAGADAELLEYAAAILTHTIGTYEITKGNTAAAKSLVTLAGDEYIFRSILKNA